MSDRQVGSLVAIQDADGTVYMGIVSDRQDKGYVVDVIADNVYRGPSEVKASG